MEAETLKDSLKRCSPETIEAAMAYHQTGDASHAPTVVLGIIERFVEAEARPKLRSGDDSISLSEDLGVDSLLMMEIVMKIEDTLEISINNEELKDIRTVADLKGYLARKLNG